MTPAHRMSRWAIAALAAALAARIVTMALLPVTDSTEGRYAQVSQEMASTGDWVTPRVWMDERHLPFLGKPPLYFWAAAGAMRLLGENEFAARLPSLLAVLALLGLLYAVMERYAGTGTGLTSVAVTASCGAVFSLGGSVATDMLLSTCVAGSLLGYFAFIREDDRQRKRRWSLLVFGLLALGFLTKGPVALMLFGLPVLFWTIRWRQWRLLREHRWIVGGAFFIVLVLPWFALCERHNPGFLKYFFLNENLLRFLTHNYGDAYGGGHQYARGSALMMAFVMGAPWTLYALVRFARADRAEVRTLMWSDPSANFLFLGATVGVLFWCLARQLLFTYLLPMVPLFAAWLVWSVRDNAAARRRILAAACALLAVLSAGVLIATPFLTTTRSTRGIVELAHGYAVRHAYDGPLVFVRQTPYSALFYGRGWVTPHPNESLRESLAHRSLRGTTLLVALARSQKKELAGLAAASWKTVASSGEWSLLRIALPSAAPQS